ncbi:MAG: hypothetical protein II951_00645 [Bacteroidales bacterium]|nr:hypothetical protein [Bacteroidales bacterium]
MTHDYCEECPIRKELQTEEEVTPAMLRQTTRITKPVMWMIALMFV